MNETIISILAAIGALVLVIGGFYILFKIFDAIVNYASKPNREFKEVTKENIKELRNRMLPLEIEFRHFKRNIDLEILILKLSG
jgi:hypothetical protein